MIQCALSQKLKMRTLAKVINATKVLCLCETKSYECSKVKAQYKKKSMRDVNIIHL